MYQFQIRINDIQSSLLELNYKLLFQHLNKGNSPIEQYMTALKETMQEILFNQKGLKDFWAKVNRAPDQFHHLHLVYRKKELLNLPWQMAIDEDRYPFLFISKSTSTVSTKGGFLLKPAPLKLLVMISSPEDLGIDGRLQYEAEKRMITAALGPLHKTGQVQINFTHGKLQTLQQQLTQDHYHILYYTGHGEYKNDTGYLVLEDEQTGKKQLVNAQKFGRALTASKEHTPALVILASCQTAQGHAESGFRGLADELTHVGIPAVIAMATVVIDYYATHFAASFFEELVKKHPLAMAYGNALKAIKKTELLNNQKRGFDMTAGQWLVPQLYCNEEVDQIVNWHTDNASTSIPPPVLDNDNKILLNKPADYIFIGRRQECSQVFNLLLNNKPVLIKGAAGIGKTAMAEELVDLLKMHNRTYQYFAFDHSCIGIEPMMAKLQQYLEGVHQYQPETSDLHNPVDKLALRVLETARHCKPIWIFDQLELGQENTGGPLKERYREWHAFVNAMLLNSFPVIFTGRYSLVEWPQINEICLQQAGYSDFYQKCCQLPIQSIQKVNKLVSIRLASNLLYQLLGGNYKALELFNEIYENNAHSISSIFYNLRFNGTKTDGMETYLNDTKIKIWQQLTGAGDQLLEQLTEQEQYVLQLLTCFREPVLSTAVKMQMKEVEVAPVLERLHHMTLLEKYSDGYYQLTPLVRSRLTSSPLCPVELRHNIAADYYFNVEDSDERTLVNLQEAFWHYSTVMDINRVNTVGSRLANYYHEDGNHTKMRYYASRTEAICGDKTKAVILNILGMVALKNGNFDAAIGYFQRVLVISRDDNDKDLEATALSNLSMAYLEKGDERMASQFSRKANSIDVQEETADKICARLNNQAHLLLKLDKADEALTLMEKCRAIAKERKYAFGEAGALALLGQLYMGDWKKAEAAFKDGLIIIDNTNYINIKANLYGNLGILYNQMGQSEAALEKFQYAYDLSVKAGDVISQAIILNAIGGVYNNRHEPAQAFLYLNESLALHLQSKNLQGIASTRHNLSQAYLLSGKSEEAIKEGKLALEILREHGNKSQVLAGLLNLSNVYGYLNNIKESLEYLQEASSLSEIVGDRMSQDVIASNLGYMSLQEGRDDKAFEYLVESAKSRIEQKNYLGAGELFVKLADIALKWKKYQTYLAYLVQSYDLFIRAENNKRIYDVGIKVGLVYIYGTIDDGVELDYGNESAEDMKRRRLYGIGVLKRCYDIMSDAGSPDAPELLAEINEALDTFNLKSDFYL